MIKVNVNTLELEYEKKLEKQEYENGKWLICEN